MVSLAQKKCEARLTSEAKGQLRNVIRSGRSSAQVNTRYRALPEME